LTKPNGEAYRPVAVTRYDPAEVEQLLKLAARITGRVGGAAKTPAKQAASRENGQKGGRPRLQNPSPATQLRRIARDRVAAGVCRHCGGAVPCSSEFGDVRVGVRRKRPAK
jgi:hypothetical protein